MSREYKEEMKARDHWMRLIKDYQIIFRTLWNSSCRSMKWLKPSKKNPGLHISATPQHELVLSRALPHQRVHIVPENAQEKVINDGYRKSRYLRTRLILQYDVQSVDYAGNVTISMLLVGGIQRPKRRERLTQGWWEGCWWRNQHCILVRGRHRQAAERWRRWSWWCLNRWKACLLVL